MTELYIIRQIEKKLNIKLPKFDRLRSRERGYMPNQANNVVGLSLYNCQLRDLQGIVANLKELSQLTEIDLSVNNLTDISSLKELRSLTSLNLTNNELIDISPLKELKQLIELSLGNNQFSDISSLENLSQLTKLSFVSCNVSDISPLKELKNLTELSMGINPLKNISALANLTNLKRLQLWESEINDISPIRELVNLEELFIEVTPLSDITPLKNLINLTYLNLWKNQISDISALKDLKKLTNLELSKNPIEKLPSWITDFNMGIEWREHGAARKISIFNDVLKIPPIDIVKQGKQAIKNYFSQIEKEKGKTEYLFEAKLLVIGEGGTGKTTFIRKMQNINSEMPHETDSTLGIEVSKWNYSIDFPKMPELNNTNFHVNLWDFGGQKIYQGTHQIFFSDKSFYVLIADTREQKTDFSYWLNTVEQLGGDNSPLIIVLNKKFGHEQKFDESGYRGHFGKIIKDVSELDLKNDKSKLHDLQDKIKMYLKQLPGIGDPLPPSWVSIREDLLKEKVNFISFDHFREICERYNIKEASMIHTLSGYFSRIGAFTHYIDDELLQERIYINSNWLVKTVYEVLDNEIAKSKKGRLSELDIKKIWGNNELHYEVNKLTQLMHKFGLMYHIVGSDNYVVPAHLPTVTPYKEWAHADSNNILQFNYEFDKYMPQGIMSRLIVGLNHHIKDHDLVWHRGVNIEANGAYAEIIESYGGSNRFEIRIGGVNKIELLAIIRERFAEVLKPFNNLQYKQLVPCICDECKFSTEPAFHDYNLLLKFREKGTGSQCSKTGEIVSAEELLKLTEPQVNIKASKAEKASEIKTIKIFLASSTELVEDRKALREFISVENDRIHKEGIYLEIIQWEYFTDAMSIENLQSEYNKAIRECDIFLSLFFTKVGKYTAQEFETAFGQFKNLGKPFVFTYFKDAPINLNQIKEADMNSKFKFEETLAKLGHFKTVYKDINDLENQFKKQLERLLPILYP
ncbi:MAG TPA: COR domain-containing protein [Chitinophagales bacterium]|nr:COR domain-containing protein [Chitinophagales bacterium]